MVKPPIFFCLHLYTSKKRANIMALENLGFERFKPIKKETK